jgi:serine protease Do
MITYFILGKWRGVFLLIVLMFVFFGVGRRVPFSPQQALDATVKVIASNSVEQINGSGVFINQNGLVITNFHNIDGANKIEIVVRNGKRYTAILECVDSSRDLALLKISINNPFFFTVMDAPLPGIGTTVYAIGSPIHLEFTYSSGIVGGLNRNIGAIPYRHALESFIQTDVPLDHGCSGGPLFNARGELLGINTAIWSSDGHFEGYSFAIPSYLVYVFLQKYFFEKKSKCT